MAFPKASILCAFLLVLAACAAPTVKNCSADIKCFGESEKTCSPARISITQEGVTQSMEIIEPQGDACVEKISVKEKTSHSDATCMMPKANWGTQMSLADSCKYCTGSLIESLKHLKVC